MAHTCALCGAVFIAVQRTQRYCTRRCYNNRRPYAERIARREANAPRKHCSYCGELFPVVQKLRSTYCSRSCRSSAINVQRTNGSCGWRCEVEWARCQCGAPLTKRGRRSYCSARCRRRSEKYVRVPPSPYHCVTCGRVALGRAGTMYCGRACTPRYGKGRREVPRSVRLAVAKRDRWQCWLCGEGVPRHVPANHPRELTADHVVPRSLGGSDDPINLRAAHRLCNSRRGNRVDWAA